jgi:glycosyltransferase involved in cell wall biosynthesis
MFVLNLCEGMRNLASDWSAVGGVFSNLGEVGQQMLDNNLSVIGPFPRALLHEDYMEAMYAECSQLKPKAVIANLGGDAFDFLRFVPESVLRVAIIHSDDECVYQQVEAYLPWIDLIVGVSARNCEIIQRRLGEHRVPVQQIACGVPMPQSVTRIYRNNGPLRVLYLGRISEEQKRVSLMTQVIKQSLQMGIDVTWTIVGDGPELPMMRSCFDLNDTRLRILGAMEYSKVPAVIAEHDIYFLCSDYEGLPLSMLEAMGAGCVPVVSDLPSGISEVVNESNGIRVPIDHSQGYVDALASLCNDRERIKRMSVNAIQTVRDYYSTIAMARRWNQTLEMHQPRTETTWNETCVADPPPRCGNPWYFHPRMRPLRLALKKMKSIRKTFKP